MLLVGFPASGKTTLLNRAFQEKLPIFGSENQGTFNSVISKKIIDSDIDTTIGNYNRLPFTQFKNIHSIIKTNSKQDFVCHLSLKFLYDKYIFLGNKRYQFGKEYNGKNQDELDWRSILYLKNIFSQNFKDIHVNILQPDYETNRNNYLKRQFIRHKTIKKLRAFDPLYRHFPRRNVRDNYYIAWTNHMKALNISSCHETSYGPMGYKISRSSSYL